MKKLFSVLLALAMLLVPVLSMAEAAEELVAEYETYTHTGDQYSFMYPNTWTLLSKENIQTIFEAVSETEDEQLAQMIAAYGPQIEEMDMVVLLSETGLANVNIVAQYVGMQATDEDLLSLASMLVSQLSNTMEGIEFVDEGSIIELVGKNGLMVEYTFELSGTQMTGVQVYVSGETDLYTFTYTCADANELEATAEDFGIMLGSLTAK